MSFSSELKDRRLIKNAHVHQTDQRRHFDQRSQLSQTNASPEFKPKTVTATASCERRQQRFTRIHLSRYWHSPQVNCSAVMESAEAASETEG